MNKNEVEKVSLTGSAIQYLQKQFPNASFIKDIKLHDVGNGPEIYYWGLSDPQPTEEELNVAAASMQPKVEKPSVEESLQLLYNDQKNNTKTFSARIDAVGTDVISE